MQQPSKSPAQFNEPVMITPLRSNEAACTGRFIDLSSDSMRIKSNADLEVGSLQKLEVGTTLMMTEVHECAPDKDGFSAGLLILAWIEKSELKRLLREASTWPEVEAAAA